MGSVFADVQVPDYAARGLAMERVASTPMRPPVANFHRSPTTSFRQERCRRPPRAAGLSDGTAP